jgi:hypothetical protein
VIIPGPKVLANLMILVCPAMMLFLPSAGPAMWHENSETFDAEFGFGSPPGPDLFQVEDF